MSERKFSSMNLDHLGLVAGMYDELEIGKQIDTLIPQDFDQRNISVGTAVKGMVLNCLGFVNRQLYLVSSFFENKPIDRLFDPSVKSTHFNDDVLGRALDALYDANPTTLYSHLANHASEKLGLSSHLAHLDSTSFHVDGKYIDPKYDSDDESVIHITQGYSRDHRPDLKQFVLNLIVENKAGIPLLMDVGDGNKIDKNDFPKLIEAHAASLQNVHDIKFFVADSALYSQKNILQIANIPWITRVPETIKSAKEVIATLDPEMMEPYHENDNYRFASLCSTYGGVNQRWLVVYSADAYKRTVKTAIKNVAKKSEQEFKAFQKLTKKKYSCPSDCQKAGDDFLKSCKYITMTPMVEKIQAYTSKGVLTKKSQDNPDYRITGNPVMNLTTMESIVNKKGYFILATNDLFWDNLSDTELFQAYKGQSKVEKGFRFLKDPDLLVSAIYLKSPKRIEALLMVMTLCLMVYAALEHRLRNELKTSNTLVPNQVGKMIRNPTMKWIFHSFHGIHVLLMNDSKYQQILNTKDIHYTILKLLKGNYEQYYQ